MKILLVDGDSLLVRASRAVSGRRDMSLSDRVAVFLGSLLRVIRETQPDRIIVGWDSLRPLWRRKIYPEYKGARRRSGAPNTERDMAQDFLELMGIPEDVFPGCEADDVVAAYWRIRHPEDQTIIVSGDKDLLQLACPRVKILMPPGDYWDAARVQERFGVSPRALPLLRALEGDKSDNIPGMPGVGHKTALRLIREDPEARVAWVFTKFSNFHIREFENFVTIINLNSSDAMDHQHNSVHVPSFCPVASPDSPGYTELLERLKEEGMTRLAAALEGGTMWGRAC